MQKIGTLTIKRLNQHKLGDSARASLVLHMANQFLEKQFEPTEMKAISLKNGNLRIATAGAVWNQELWGLKEELLGHLKAEFGEKMVSKILTASFSE